MVGLLMMSLNEPINNNGILSYCLKIIASGSEHCAGLQLRLFLHSSSLLAATAAIMKRIIAIS